MLDSYRLTPAGAPTLQRASPAPRGADHHADTVALGVGVAGDTPTAAECPRHRAKAITLAVGVAAGTPPAGE